MGVTPSWPMEASSVVRGRVRARQKTLDDDRQTDRYTPSIHYTIIRLIYASAPLGGANAYMFYRCFLVFLFFVFFRLPQKYQITVLGNG